MKETAGRTGGVRRGDKVEETRHLLYAHLLCRYRWTLPLSGLLLIITVFLLAYGQQGRLSGAYFTTYASAKGGYEIQAGTETEIHEEIDGLNKHIRIENTGAADCFVRVKAFAGSITDIIYSPESGSWQEGEGGYWYCMASLAPGEVSGELTVSIKIPEGMEDMAGSFDVVVIQECTPVLYHADGTVYADWNRKIEKAPGEVG